MQVIAVGIMGGLGFTMSILIAGLAFSDPSQVMAAKCAILVGSVTSAIIGVAFVRIADMVITNRHHRERIQS
jgi:NhaA family Na+:H+ antiporter